MDELNLNKKKNNILGELDELNSLIGLAKSFVKDREIRKLLTNIQNDIIVIQANIASPRNAIYLPPNTLLDDIVSLQKQTYWIEKGLKKLNHFIIPEGATSACYLHCARTVARRIERKMRGYLKDRPPILARYFDRLACLMFALARYINKKEGIKERSPKYFVQRNLQTQKTITRERRGK